ncbi:MAG: hypothetical protein K8R02_09885 [Anaerohalosphaeraceae bacterium]|nr:hypothetical protein [Anaerohalosphaeraceae bacterium]
MQIPAGQDLRANGGAGGLLKFANTNPQAGLGAKWRNERHKPFVSTNPNGAGLTNSAVPAEAKCSKSWNISIIKGG